MKLYHTSTLEIRKPDLYRGRKNADFGQGFYLTPDWEFCRRWATGNAVINEYGWIRAEKAPGQDPTLRRAERTCCRRWKGFGMIFPPKNMSPLPPCFPISPCGKSAEFFPETERHWPRWRAWGCLKPPSTGIRFCC